MNIENLLKEGIIKLNKNNIDDSNLKAKLLLAYLLNVNKEYLLINNREEVNKKIEQKYFKSINLLIKGKPIQYITKTQEFMGIKFFVDEKVLIPQPDTEILVEKVIESVKKINKKKQKIEILDLCTGSGAIAISIAKEFENNKNIRITATDIDEKVIKIAKKNAINNGVKINFLKSNMFSKINDKFDIIVSNPPYIESEIIKTLSIEVQNEPILALDGGKDGLDFYRKIANNAFKFLNKDGVLLLEIGFNQKEEVSKLLKDKVFYKNIECFKDYAGNNRVIYAYRQ